MLSGFTNAMGYTMQNLTNLYPVWSPQIEQQMFTEGDPDPKGATPDELGEAGKEALRKERERANTAEKELKKFRDDAEAKSKAELSEVDRLKSELATATSANEKLTREVTRYKVGIAEKVDPTLISRIQGDDEAAMIADAKEVAKFNPGVKPPKADPTQGRKGDGSSGLSKQDQLSDVLDGLFDKQD